MTSSKIVIRADRNGVPVFLENSFKANVRDSRERARVLLTHAQLLAKVGRVNDALPFLARVVELLTAESNATGLFILIQALEAFATLQIERGEPAFALKCAQSAKSVQRELVVDYGGSETLLEIGISLTHLMSRAWLELGDLQQGTAKLQASQNELTILERTIGVTPELMDLQAHQLRLEIAASPADPERVVQFGEHLVALRREAIVRFGRCRSHIEKLADAVGWHADCLLVAELVEESHFFYLQSVDLRRALVTISGADNKSLIALGAALLAAAQSHLYSGRLQKAEELALEACQALQKVRPEQLDCRVTYPIFADTSIELAGLLVEFNHRLCTEAERVVLAAIQAADQLPLPESEDVRAIRASLRVRASSLLERTRVSPLAMQLSEEARRLIA